MAIYSRALPDQLLSQASGSPAGNPQAQGNGPGQTAEVIFGQILQTMQAGMAQMAQGFQQRLELLEGGMQDEARALAMSADAKALETFSKRSRRGYQGCWKASSPERVPRG